SHATGAPGTSGTSGAGTARASQRSRGGFPLGSGVRQVVEDLRGMNGHVHLPVRLRDVPVRSDYERLALVMPLEGHAVAAADLAVGIAEQEERQLVVGDEVLVGLGRVGRDADQDGSGLRDVLPGVTEGACLLRAARGLVLRVEIDDDALALESREVNGRAVLRLAGEVGRGLPDEIVRGYDRGCRR